MNGGGDVDDGGNDDDDGGVVLLVGSAVMPEPMTPHVGVPLKPLMVGGRRSEGRREMGMVGRAELEPCCCACRESADMEASYSPVAGAIESASRTATRLRRVRPNSSPAVVREAGRAFPKE